METKAISVEIAIYSIDKDEADRFFARFVELIEQKDEDAEAAGHTYEMGSCVFGFELYVTGFWGFPPLEEVIEDFKEEVEGLRDDVTVDWAIEDASATE
jgi:hypothetical protein